MSYRIKFITIIGIFTLNCVFDAYANTADDIYHLAKQSSADLKTIVNIDTLDTNGNTALCNAILNDDIVAYNNLIKYGADEKHACVKNISKNKYNKFIAKVNKAPNKKFFGLSKWGWSGILGGVAVAGGGIAMAGGGSGGGSGGGNTGSTNTGGNNQTPGTNPDNDDWAEYDASVRAEFPFAQNEPCPNGYLQSECRALSTGEYYCKCDNYVNCPSSYQIQCQNGFHETSNTCQSGPNILKECVADTCPSDYKTNCGNGYHAGQTCQSGDTTYMECVANTCDGFNYLETDTCPKGWLGGSACQSGDVTKYKCDLPDTCPHNYKTSCGAGYHATENTCQSGNEILYECIANTCPSDYKTSCNTGYHVGNTCQSGDTTYMECVADTCDGFDYDESSACPVGWAIGTSCQAGNTTKYKCDKPATCPSNYKTSCDTGFHESANKCTSGNRVLTECIADTCPYNYKASCDVGYHETGNKCTSGTMELKECVENTCPDNYKFIDNSTTNPNTKCDAGYHATSNTCLKGDVLLTECVPNTCDGFDYAVGDTCPDGWEFGTSCQVGTDVPKYKCDKTVLCPADYKTNCGEVGTTGISCKSGNITYYECKCGNNATLSGGKCVCNPGYTGNGYECVKQITIETQEADTADHYAINNDTESRTAHVYASDGTLEVAEINITHNGEGNVYGMYSQENKSPMHNALTDNAPTSHAIGTINIDNLGAGIAYGMYGNDIYNETYINPDRPEDILSKSTINLNNLSGRVYGMHGNTVFNSGEININQINGAAYGISYTENAMNTGTINITRQPFLSHTPTDTVAGAAYGIHGNGIWKSTVQNDGTISIKDHSIATGIHAQNGATVTNNGTIDISSTRTDDVSKTTNIYGLYVRDIKNTDNTGYITLNNATNAAGIEWYNQYYEYVKNSGRIYLNNIKYANGMAQFAGNMSDTTPNIANDGLISISGSFNARGISFGGATAINNGRINITKTESDAFGIYAFEGMSTIENNDYIIIEHSNNATGLYANGERATDSSGTTKIGTNIINSGNIYISNITDSAFGIKHGEVGNSTIKNDGIIYINRNTTTGNETYYGIYSASDYITEIKNTGTITIGDEYFPTHAGYGIFASGNLTRAENSGTITIKNIEDTSYGIYAANGANVTNAGTITISSGADSSADVYGIYATDPGTTVTNTGTIILNNDACFGNSCNNNKHIVLENGATFINGGEMSASAFDFDSMNGNIVATNGAQFIAENDISGTLNLSSEIVTDGFNTTYVAENMIQAGDTSKLNLHSGSAMFDAKLADNGNDVVMTMKSFDTLTDNKSLATYLADNYAKGTSAEFFGGLKSGANMTEFNNILNGLSGMNAFTQFDREDMSAMREINFSMNQQMFMNNDRDEYQVSGSMEHFSFSNSSNGGSGSYGISNSRMSDNWKLGYGLAMANIGTNDDLGTSRSNQIGLFYMPMTYTNDNIEFISTPRVGFAKSHYSRRGYNNMNYDGYIEKQIFGFNNDLRYPVTFGNWTIAPDLGFNAIMYRQSGHESDQAFSLIIPADEIYSVEAGFGLFTKYERKLDNGSLRFNSGVMLYRELADTYNMKLGIRGLDGTFNLYDNAEHDYSGAATFGFDYESGRFSLYGNAQYFVDSDAYTNVKAGFRLYF